MVEGTEQTIFRMDIGSEPLSANNSMAKLTIASKKWTTINIRLPVSNMMACGLQLNESQILLVGVG